MANNVLYTIDAGVRAGALMKKDRKFHVRRVPPPSLFSNLEPEYTPQWVNERSTSDSEKSKQVRMTQLFINKSHLWRSLSI